MSSRLVFSVVFVLGVGLTGCVASSTTSSSDGGNAPAPHAMVPKSAVGPTIAALRTHDGLISITSAPGGLRVTLATTAGDVTGRDLTLEELRARDPEAYDVVTTSRAFVDASIDRGPIDRSPRSDLGDRSSELPGAAPPMR